MHPYFRKLRRFAAVSLASMLVWFALDASAAAAETLVFFGTFTNQLSRGIYVSRLDVATGRLTAPELAAETPNPGFIALSPGGKFLYAANNLNQFNGEKAGAVSAFAVDAATGKLTALNQKSSGGANPCHVSVDATGRAVFVANYTSGSVKSLRVNADGSLSEDGSLMSHTGRSLNPSRQSGPHAHDLVADPSNRFALACDLGADRVMIYRLNAAKATLTPGETPFATVPPGSGARHITFSPGGRFAYVINELACTLATFAWDAPKGKLSVVETVALLPKEVAVDTSMGAAEVAVHPGGRFVYGSVRGHDSLSVFAVDGKSGGLTLVENVPCGGKIPRCFGIDPTGRWLVCANQKSDDVTVFAINATTGRLTPTGQKLPVGAPLCVKFL